MKRRTFLKGLGVALLAPATLLKGAKVVSATSVIDVPIGDNTSVHMVSWDNDDIKITDMGVQGGVRTHRLEHKKHKGLEAWSEIDQALLDLAEDPQMVIHSELQPVIEAIMQEIS